MRRPSTRGRVLASFARVSDLLTDDGAIVALAWDGVRNGPLNILLDHKPGAALPAGTRFVVSGAGILLALDPPIRIELAGARPWDACPDWRGLAARRGQIAEQARTVAALLDAEAPAGSLGRLAGANPAQTPAPRPTPALKGLAERATRTCGGARETDASGRVSGMQPRRALLSQPGALAPGVTTETAHLPIAARAISDLQTAYARGDLPALRAAASRLCGLGPGLTPAGDDWLAGWLIGLRAWNGDEHVEAIGAAVLAVAQERTTTLSRAFLACAAAGEVDENWLGLLSALAEGSEIEVMAATRSIMAQGATSGADMLGGFLAGLDAQNSRIDPTRRLSS